MTGLEIAALAAIALWLAVLSAIALLLIRQIGLVTVRLSLAAPHTPASASGPEIGAALSEEGRNKLGRGDDSFVLLLFSASCGTCRSLASRLGERDVAAGTLVLIPGEHEKASAVAELIPNRPEIRLDPEATEIADRLGLDTVPFGMRIDNNTISMKSFLNEPDDVLRLTRGEGPAFASLGEPDSTQPISAQPISANGQGQKEVASR